MLANQASSTPENSPVNQAALAVLLAVVASATLFPETFIEEFPLIGTRWTFPLTLLLPLMTVTAALLLVEERSRIHLHAVDAFIGAYLAFLLARNLSGDHSFFTVKYVAISTSVYILAALLAANQVQLKRIFFSISALVILTALYGLAEFAAQDNFLFQPHITFGRPDDELHRVGSFLAQPVVYGSFLVQCLPFSILLWVRGWKRWLRYFGLAATILAIICLLLTFSKGSWIAAFLVALAATIYFVKTRGRRNITIAMVVLLFIGMLAGIYLNRSLFEDIIRFDTSVDARAVAWEAAVDGLRENPVIGVGLKEGEAEIEEQIPDSIKEKYDDFRPPTDNNYLNTFLEGGIIGGLLWAVMMILILVGGYRQIMRKREVRYMLVAAFLSIISLMINMVTFDAMLIWPSMILFWMSVGILRGYYDINGGPPGSPGE